jgi:hypothetical protein
VNQTDGGFIIKALLRFRRKEKKDTQAKFKECEEAKCSHEPGGRNIRGQY